MSLAEQIISDMGWDWENTESSARRVAEHCTNTMYSEEEVLDLLEFVNDRLPDLYSRFNPQAELDDWLFKKKQL